MSVTQNSLFGKIVYSVNSYLVFASRTVYSKIVLLLPARRRWMCR